MSKKNKNRNGNNQQVTNANKPAANPTDRPVIVVRPANEILTTEDGEALLTESLRIMDEYCKGKRDEADKYYDDRKGKADKYYSEKEELANGLEEKKQAEIDQAVEQAEGEARSRIEQENKDKSEALQKQQEELVKKGEEYAKQLAKLEADKITYKQEVLGSIDAEMSVITEEKINLEKEIDDLKNTIRKKDAEITALEDDKAFYEDQLSKNNGRKAEVESYKLKIDELQTTYATLEKLYNEKVDELNRVKELHLLYSDDPQGIIGENTALKEKNKKLESLIADCPAAEELKELRVKSAKYEELENKLEIANSEISKLEAEKLDLKVCKDDIENYRRFIKLLELQKAELQRELDRNIELYNNTSEKIFASLSLIDDKQCDEYPSMRSSITLKQLCEKFRGYLANRENTPLYYEEETIRTFIAGFASARIMILEGLSGTGKSSLPQAFADFMGSKTIKVPVQSSWKDRNDLLGFYNDFKKQYKETEFLKALYTATHDKNNIYIIVLDEMNLSRIEYYFADLLSVLEEPEIEKWKIELISDYASISRNPDSWPKLIHDGKLQICDNTWFVGTANKDDSTFIITDKVYDRSVVLNFDKKGEKQKCNYSAPIQMNNSDFQALLNAASHFKSDKDAERFHTMMKYLDEQVKDMFQITFGNRIANQLEKFVPVYIECGGTVDEAVDVMFSRKILRKLEGIYDEDTKLNLEMLRDDIKAKYHMPITISAIERMVEKM